MSDARAESGEGRLGSRQHLPRRIHRVRPESLWQTDAQAVRVPGRAARVRGAEAGGTLLPAVTPCVSQERRLAVWCPFGLPHGYDVCGLCNYENG